MTHISKGQVPLAASYLVINGSRSEIVLIGIPTPDRGEVPGSAGIALLTMLMLLPMVHRLKQLVETGVDTPGRDRPFVRIKFLLDGGLESRLRR